MPKRKPNPAPIAHYFLVISLTNDKTIYFRTETMRQVV